MKLVGAKIVIFDSIEELVFRKWIAVPDSDNPNLEF